MASDTHDGFCPNCRSEVTFTRKEGATVGLRCGNCRKMWAAPTLSEAQDHCPAYPPEEYDAEAALEEIQHRADRAADHGEPATVPVAVMNHWIEVLSDG